MSCDFNRNELRQELINSASLLLSLRKFVPNNEESGGYLLLIEETVQRAKKVLKTEAATRPRLANPETCPLNDTP